MSGSVHVDPQAQALLDHIAAQMEQAPKPDHPPSEAERVAMTRQGYAGTAELGGEPEYVANVDDREAPGPAGPIPLRTY